MKKMFLKKLAAFDLFVLGNWVSRNLILFGLYSIYFSTFENNFMQVISKFCLFLKFYFKLSKCVLSPLPFYSIFYTEYTCKTWANPIKLRQWKSASKIVVVSKSPCSKSRLQNLHFLSSISSSKKVLFHNFSFFWESPFFSIGVTTASFHSPGTSPVAIDVFTV